MGFLKTRALLETHVWTADVSIFEIAQTDCSCHCHEGWHATPSFMLLTRSLGFCAKKGIETGKMPLSAVVAWFARHF